VGYDNEIRDGQAIYQEHFPNGEVIDFISLQKQCHDEIRFRICQENSALMKYPYAWMEKPAGLLPFYSVRQTDVAMLASVQGTAARLVAARGGQGHTPPVPSLPRYIPPMQMVQVLSTDLKIIGHYQNGIHLPPTLWIQTEMTVKRNDFLSNFIDVLEQAMIRDV
jgi:hypothetical protein